MSVRTGFGILAVVGVLLLLCYPLIRSAGSVTTVDEPVATPRIEGDELVVPKEIVAGMRLRSAPVSGIERRSKLRLTGQLLLDPGGLVHVRTRFGGEVVQIGGDATAETTVRVGQQVDKGELLAVLWSKDVGEKKSDYVDALSQLYLHESTFKRFKALEATGAVPQRNLDEVRRIYESDLIQVERFRRTLVSWRILGDELLEVEREAQRIHANALAGPADSALPAGGQAIDSKNIDPTWANTEIRSPIKGIVLERNLTVGDIVNTDIDLFKVADMSQLLVVANIYEDDLPTLLALKPEERVWDVEVLAAPAADVHHGKIDLIGNVVDPNQHTLVLQGRIDNANGELRIGQFIQTTIWVPAKAGALEIPIEALLDSGSASQVLVSTSEDHTRWRRQKVEVRRRTSKFAWVEASGSQLRAGDRVLVRAGLELLSVFNELQPEAIESTRTSAQ